MEFLGKTFTGHGKNSEDVERYFSVIRNYFSCAEYLKQKGKDIDGFYNRLSGVLDVGEELKFITSEEKYWIDRKFLDMFF